MKANEFVKYLKNGIESAKELMEVRPYMLEEMGIDLSDLKRLVESWELVEKSQGLNGAKNTLKLLQSSLDLGLHHGIEGVKAETEIPKLKQAISDVEACQ